MSRLANWRDLIPQHLRFSKLISKCIGIQDQDHTFPRRHGVMAQANTVFHCEVDAEPLERYRKGGYHPTHLRDHFKDGRYRIIHKLGWGAYATVWLAKDML